MASLPVNVLEPTGKVLNLTLYCLQFRRLSYICFALITVTPKLNQLQIITCFKN
jgi:hypothetical protein